MELKHFVPEKTAAYIDQYDLHVPEMTVRETIDFSARFQGVGNRAGNCPNQINGETVTLTTTVSYFLRDHEGGDSKGEGGRHYP